MNLAKITKAKSFDKRMELVLQGVKEADEVQRCEAIDALCAAAKYANHWVDIMALCIYLKSSKTVSVIGKTISMIDHPMLVPQVSGLLMNAGKTVDAIKLIESYKDQLSFTHQLIVAWCLDRFGGEKVLSRKLIGEVESMILDESMAEIRNEQVAYVKMTPPVPPVMFSNFRFFLSEGESGFDWFGNSVAT